jgi:glyoxylase-like metal-dependent hydrolase (beta-lactamase superfamily II)
MGDKMQSKKYTIIEPASFKLDGGAMFGIIPKPLWNKVHPSDDENRIDLALRLVLIQTNGKNILIDTGIGDYHGDKFDERFGITKGESPLEMALKEINLTASDITDLIVSHLHFDHIGGLTKIENGKMISTLPNATIHLHEKHFEYSKNPTDRDSGSFHIQYFLPVLEEAIKNNKIHFLKGLEGEIIEGIKFKCSMGHTPYLVHAYDEKFIYLADLIPTSNHVHIPWVMGYDISPGVTTADKKEFLNFIFEKNLTVIYEHDPKYFGSKIIKDTKNNYICGEKFNYSPQKAYSIFNS